MLLAYVDRKEEALTLLKKSSYGNQQPIPLLLSHAQCIHEHMHELSLLEEIQLYQSLSHLPIYPEHLLWDITETLRLNKHLLSLKNIMHTLKACNRLHFKNELMLNAFMEIIYRKLPLQQQSYRDEVLETINRFKLNTTAARAIRSNCTHTSVQQLLVGINS